MIGSNLKSQGSAQSEISLEGTLSCVFTLVPIKVTGTTLPQSRQFICYFMVKCRPWSGESSWEARPSTENLLDHPQESLHFHLCACFLAATLRQNRKHKLWRGKFPPSIG